MRDGHITCAGAASACHVPAKAIRLDARGMWVMPGLIDAHVHFSQTGWFDGRPDAADLRDSFPYDESMANLEANPGRFFPAYRCAGVTSVFDVGGYTWTWALRRRFGTDSLAPRIAAAGPLLATVDHWLNLPAERVIIYMATDSVVRAVIREDAAFHSDAVKVWYIMPPQPPLDTAKAQARVRVAAAEARKYNLPLIVHATGLWEAKDAIRAGASVLVHSVFESPVDSEFVALAREHKVIYVPTIMVYAGYTIAAQGGLDSLGYRTTCVDSATIAHVQAGPPADRAKRQVSAATRARVREADQLCPGKPEARVRRGDHRRDGNRRRESGDLARSLGVPGDGAHAAGRPHADAGARRVNQEWCHRHGTRRQRRDGCRRESGPTW